MVDIPGNSTTTTVITVGGSVSGSLETIGDHDWFRLTLTAGQVVTILLDGITLEDAYLRIRNSSGNLLAENDDISSGVVRDSRLVFEAPSSGTFFIDAGGWEDDYSGTYQLSVETYTPPPVATYDQVANQLTAGYWGGDSHHFAVGEGDSLTVNLTALTVPAQTLAREALDLWADIIGIRFTEVATGGQITFDDNQSGAFSTAVWSGGITESARVNVSTQWLADYGTGFNSYSFQTYIHEVGHALGLGHAGNYNETATFPYDAMFLNDSWPVSIMSYFDQVDNSYFANQGFSTFFVVTPMLADVLAMSELYGLSSRTRLGDTTYGYGSTAGNAIFNAGLYPTVAYTVVDSGGTDILNYSSTAATQIIDLNAETFSNVLGFTGNVSIARGTVIENALGGSGDDTLIGNAANNVLNGGAGDDIVSYAAATAGVTVNASIAGAQNTQAAGIDTLSNFERLTGSDYADTLTAGAGYMYLRGGLGDDILAASADGDHVAGEEGDDWFVGGPGDDMFVGGDGFDTADYSGANGGVNTTTGQAGADGFDELNGIEQQIGSAFDDTLYGFFNDVLVGAAGNDTLVGNSGTDRLEGGPGNDLYWITDGGDQLIEGVGEGIDTVESWVSVVLGPNFENLTLTVQGGTSGTGNELSNIITGSSGVNQLFGLGGNDTLAGNGGDDMLDGGTGNDAMSGGLGNDTYLVDQAGDLLIEAAGEGTDNVQSSISHSLAANIENLVLTGVALIAGTGNGLDNVLTGNVGDNSLKGLAGADQLVGNGGNDWLDGGTGADQLAGGAGDDTYVVDQAADLVTEGAGGGTDLVRSSASHVLGANVENLTLIGSQAINGTGNGLANVLAGNTLANVLAGADGADQLLGSNGNDTLNGGAGNDLLHGGTGRDSMAGGLGDDIYVVDRGDDVTTELAGQGIDLVESSASHTLKANIEHLTLTGTLDRNGTGNGLDNILTGNVGDNSLKGLDGNDTIDGGAGRDICAGGLGADIFVFDQMIDFSGLDALTCDVITDFSNAQGDRIDLSGLDANDLLDGDQAFDFIGDDAFGGIAGQLHFQQADGHNYLTGDTNGDAIADFMISIVGLDPLQTIDFGP